MSFRIKTIIGIATIEAVLLVFLIWTSVTDLKESNERELIERATTTATLFATTTKDAVIATDLASLDSYVIELMKNPGLIYARIVDSNNIILAEGGDPAALSVEFRADDSMESVVDGRFDTSANIKEGDYQFGRVELAISTDRISTIIGDARFRLFSIAGVELILVAVFSLLLGIYLTRQLKQLELAAERIAQGDMSTKLNINSQDEVGLVAKAFNTMIDNLVSAKKTRDQYEFKLRELNADLENRVEARTISLEEANTSLVATNDKLKDAQIQLVQSEKLASLGQLAAGVAHEINNPMGFINSNLSTLKEYIGDIKELVDYYQSVEGEISEQSRIAIAELKDRVDLEFVTDDIDNLLDESITGTDRVRDIVLELKNYSRIDCSDWQDADIHDCIKSSLKIAMNEIKYRADVSLEFGNDIPHVYCIASEVNQVLMNLMVNGGQAIESSGTLTISTGQEDDCVWIDIEDTGSGMDEATLNKMFDPFFTTKPVGEGTGLGLAICHRIIDRHGGRIDVKSELNVGTRFRVWLPITQDTAQGPGGQIETEDESLEIQPLAAAS